MVTLRSGRGTNQSDSTSQASQQYPEFFRIFLPEHNSKTLCIPPAFEENFDGNVLKNLVLRNLQGKSWQVELEEIGGRLLINKGWEDFVTSHCLELGEFLIFQYHGDGLFLVKVFGLNGCKKGDTTGSSHHLDLQVVEAARPEQITNGHVDTFKWRRSGRGMVVENRHSADSRKAIMCVPERVEDSNSLRFSKVHDYKRNYEMPIPLSFIVEHNINAPEVEKPMEIQFRNQNGVATSAMFRRRADRRLLVTQGWKPFCLQNHIDYGDEAEFEVVLDRRRRIKEFVLLQVHHKGRKKLAIRSL